MKSIDIGNTNGGWITGASDNRGHRYFFLCIGLAAFFLGAGFFFMQPEWYGLIVGLVYVAISLYFIIQFDKGVYLLIFAVPFHPDYFGILINTSWNFKIGGSYIDRLPFFVPITIAVFAGYLLSRWSKLREFQTNKLRTAFIILLVYGAGLTFYVPNFWHSFHQYFILVFNLMLFTVVFHSIEDEQAHRKVMWFWVFIAIATGLFSSSLFLMTGDALKISYPISEHLVFKMLVGVGAAAPTGLISRAHAFSTPHELGFFMNMSSAIAMGLMLSEKNKLRRWFLIGVIYFFICINLLTLGRGALGGLIIMLAFFVVAVKVMRKRFFMFSVLFIVGLIVTLQGENLIMNTVFLRDPVVTRIVKITETFANKAGIENQAPQRMEIWKKGFKNLKKSNLLGVGPGNVKYYQRDPHAHSVYFSFLFDFGLVGLGVIIFIAGTLLLGMLKFVDRQTNYMQLMNVSILGGGFAVGVHALVDFEYNTAVVWLFLAVAFATLSLTKQEAASKKSDEEPA